MIARERTRKCENQFCLPAVALLGILVFISGCSRSHAQTASSGVPDLSGIWLGKAIQSLSPSDPMAKKPGAEGDIPYTPWALARLKAERPATGPHATLENTTDPALKYADPDGYPRASIHPMRFKIVQTADYIYQLWEYNESWRQIALNRPHSEVPDISWFGESVGKWDGDTLVVDSVGSRIRRGSIRSAIPIPKIFTSPSASSESTTKHWCSTLPLTIQRLTRNPGMES